MYIPRRFRSAICLASAATGLLANAPATAEEIAPEIALAHLMPLDDATMDAERGGIAIAGMNISLGADLRTYLNGDLALQTVISWTDVSATTQRFVSSALTPASAAQLQAGLFGNGGITMRMGNETVYFANADQTALVQRVDGGIQNIVLNTASNIAVRQEADVTLQLSNYAAFRNTVAAGLLAGGIAQAIEQGAIAAVGR